MSQEKYNFVVDCNDNELENLKKINIKSGVPAGTFSKGNLCWCLQTYLILLEQRKLNIICSNRIQHDCINIVHSDDLLKLKGKPDQFIVCTRADYPARAWAHYHIVQNKDQQGQNASTIYLWPQAGIIKRGKDRHDVINVAYSGQTFNGNMVGSSEMWNQLLQPHNFKFVTIEDGRWHDLNSIDVLIGIRSFDTERYSTKPPSKLINAWHAEIPFIGGYDSAYRQIGTPGEDYLLATTKQEVINSLIRLRDEPGLYSRVVENGLQKVKKFTVESLAETWEQELNGPILERYNRWKQQPLHEQRTFKRLQRKSLFIHRIKQLVKKLVK